MNTAPDDQPIYVVGIDCATKDHKVGIALGKIEGAKCHIEFAESGKQEGSIKKLLQEWHKKTPISLIALDAPLGWPLALGNELKAHRAGQPLNATADHLFHRDTDTDVENRWKRPLEVGANLIARTARAALELLGDFRNATGEAIPLAWEMGKPKKLSAIEVYPAATRKSWGWETERVALEKRRDILARMLEHPEDRPVYSISDEARSKAEKSDHAFDALLCVVAANEFINGRCKGPPDLVLAKIEGWIWVADKPSEKL